MLFININKKIQNMDNKYFDVFSKIRYFYVILMIVF